MKVSTAIQKDTTSSLIRHRQFLNSENLCNKILNYWSKSSILNKAINLSSEKSIKFLEFYIDRLFDELISLYNLGEYSFVVQISNKIINSFPDSYMFLNLIGLSNRALGKLEISEAAFKKLINIKPNYPDAFNNLGSVLLDQNKIEEAKKYLKKAINLDNNYAEAYNNYGKALIENKEFDEAIKKITKAINLKPNYYKAFLNLGFAYYEKNKIYDAIKSFEGALKIIPNYTEAIYNLGNSFIQLGELNKALKEFKKVIAIDSNNLKAKYKIASIYQETGEHERAINLFVKILSEVPNTYELSTSIFKNLFFSLFSIKNNKISFFKKTMSNLDHITSINNKTNLAILKYRLSKGSENNNKFYNNLMSEISKEKNLNIKNENYKEKRNNQKINIPENIVALFQTGRAGTGLLHSLIDGHSKIITLPSNYFSEYFDNKIWIEITKGGWSEIIDRFIKKYPILFNASSTKAILTISGEIKDFGKTEGLCNMGLSKNETLILNQVSFKKELTYLINKEKELNALSFFKLVHVAFERVLQKQYDKNIIFYHIHNPDIYAQLNFMRLAKSTKFIMMVREPIQSCESWIKSAFFNGDYKTVVSMIYSMLFEIDNIIFSKKTSVGVRLEDLKIDPKNTIKRICDYIGIKEENSLFEMTFQGKMWWGELNKSELIKKKPNPFDHTAIKRGLGEVFSINDQFIFQTLFYPFRVRFGYIKKNDQKFISDLKKIRPLIDNTFDFEKKIIKSHDKSKKEFINSGSYQFLRATLIERWSILNELHTYPNMLKPLNIRYN